MQISVQDDPGRSRYEITVDGTLAGFVDYRLRGGILSAMHTEVFDEFQGQGLAGRLVGDMLADVRARDLALYPFCPLVHRIVRRDLEAYLDLVPENALERFRLPAEASTPASEEGPPPAED